MKLLLSQKNDFFEMIEQSKELNPNQFSYIEKTGREGDNYVDYFAIKHKSSDFYFRVDKVIYNDYRITFSPGYMEYYSASQCNSIDGSYGYFNGWLSYLEREINQVDKWGRMNEDFEGFNFLLINEDTNKFTASEFIEASAKLLILKEEIKKLNFLNTKQLELIDFKIDKLTEKLTTMDKFDWQSLFIGTFISILLQLSLSQEQGKELMGVLKRIFSTYFVH